VKRLVVAIATSGLIATSIGALAQPALAADGGLSVTIASAGTKKVDVSWADGAALASGPFDAYLVTLDNDANVAYDQADRSRFVAPATLTTRFEDLNANTTYYAQVFAIDYTVAGFVVVPATGQGADTALGAEIGTYSPVTIRSAAPTVLSGNATALSGVLKDDLGHPLAGETVTVMSDPYPQGGATEQTDVTDANGNWTITSDVLKENTSFWAEYRDTSGVGGWTGRITVEVRKTLSVSVSPGLKVAALTKVTFSGSTHGDPTFLDDAPKPVQVCLQHYEAGKWAKKFCDPVDSNGNYSLSFKPGANADGKYRTWSGMGPAYADSWSKTKKLVVN
jgi:hypothetical protein